ncbi:HisA/HisF-related TIM barrel protein [Elusimicrobiota bacterium]
MSIKFARLNLRNPYLAASGCAGYGWELESYFPGLAWGGIFSKTITVTPRQGNPPPRIFETSDSIINRIGLQNCGIKSFIDNELPQTKNLPYPVIVSIFGATAQEWTTLINDLSRKDVPAFELNMSCPNLKGEVILKDKTMCSDLVRRLKSLTNIPLIAKINAIDDPVELAKGLSNAGIDGIVCSNTLPASVLHKNQLMHGGLSGSAIKPVVLKAVSMLSSADNTDLAACGGIRSAADIEDYRKAGAKAFIIGSALFSDPLIINKIVRKDTTIT